MDSDSPQERTGVQNRGGGGVRARMGLSPREEQESMDEQYFDHDGYLSDYPRLGLGIFT